MPFADASPAVLRAALTPEDAAVFDLQWRDAMATAVERLDLTGVHAVLDAWRPVAWLTSARGVAELPAAARASGADVGGGWRAADRGGVAGRGAAADRRAPGVAAAVAYEIVTYPEADGQIAGLPANALDVLGQVLDVLQLVPWNGRSSNPSNPDGAVRLWTSGHLLVVYLILEDLVSAGRHHRRGLARVAQRAASRSGGSRHLSAWLRDCVPAFGTAHSA